MIKLKLFEKALDSTRTRLKRKARVITTQMRMLKACLMKTITKRMNLSKSIGSAGKNTTSWKISNSLKNRFAGLQLLVRQRI